VARTFFRIVTTDPPSVADFLSDKARGKTQPTDPARRDLYEGLSVYATLAQARRKARDLPVLGDYVAELRIADDALIRVERTLRSSRGHHTVWGDPEDLLHSVVAVVAVEGE
jgi:hypothetical protein